MGFSLGGALSGGLKGLATGGWGGAAIGALGGGFGGSGTSGAGSAGRYAAGAAQQSQDDMWKLSSEQQQPWYQSGRGATGNLSYLMGTMPQSSYGDEYKMGADGKMTFATPEYGGYGELGRRFTLDDFQEDPSYRFRLEEGENALDNWQSSRGNVLSGAGLKDALKYNQGMASTEYGAAHDRWRQEGGDIYSRLMGQSEQGRMSANQLNALNTNYADRTGEIAGQLGSSNAAEAIAKGNQQNQMLGGLGSLFGGGASQYGGTGGSNINWY